MTQSQHVLPLYFQSDVVVYLQSNTAEGQELVSSHGLLHTLPKEGLARFVFRMCRLTPDNNAKCVAFSSHSFAFVFVVKCELCLENSKFPNGKKINFFKGLTFTFGVTASGDSVSQGVHVCQQVVNRVVSAARRWLGASGCRCRASTRRTRCPGCSSPPDPTSPQGARVRRARASHLSSHPLLCGLVIP